MTWRNSWRAAGVIVLAALATTGCINTAGDRCWVTPHEMKAARRLYERVGSLHAVEVAMRDADYQDCEVEQVIYRLQHETLEPGQAPIDAAPAAPSNLAWSTESGSVSRLDASLAQEPAAP